MEKKELEQFICSTLGIELINDTIKRQINKFVTKRGLGYDDIARALTFHIEVKKEKYEPRYGISFIEWTADEAKEYYEKEERREKAKLNSLKKESTNIILKADKLKERKPMKKIEIGELGDD